LPRLSHPSARPALKPRGLALPVVPPDEAASCPASCILRLCRRRTLELPRVSRPSAHPVVKLRLPRSSILRLRLPMHPPGCPGTCIFRPCRRWIFELPRNLASFSTPATSTPGFPAVSHLQLRLPTHFPGCPGSCIFRLCRRRTLELPRVSRPSAPLVLVLRVAPQLRVSRCASRHGCESPRTPTPSGFALGLISRVAPNHHSLGAGRWLSELPRFAHLPACRPCVPRLPRVLHLRLGQS